MTPSNAKDDARDPASNERVFGSEPNEYPNAKPCTCHPDDRPAECQHRYAATECNAAFNAKDDVVEAVALDDLRELADRLESGTFFQDYDEDLRLMGVLKDHVAAIEAMRAAQPVEDVTPAMLDDGFRAAGKLVNLGNEQLKRIYLAMRAAHVTAQEGK